MNPFEQLMAALSGYKSQLDGPMQHTQTVSGAQAPAGLLAAKQTLESTLGEIPLPMDHPGWQQIAGAVMAAMGAVDGAVDMFEGVKQKAHDATAAIQQAQAEVDNVISQMRG